MQKTTSFWEAVPVCWKNLFYLTLRRTPGEGSPHFDRFTVKISPFLRFLKAQVFRPLRRSTQGFSPWEPSVAFSSRKLLSLRSMSTRFQPNQRFGKSRKSCSKNFYYGFCEKLRPPPKRSGLDFIFTLDLRYLFVAPSPIRLCLLRALCIIGVILLTVCTNVVSL